MVNSSPFLLIKRVEGDVRRLLSDIDVTTLQTKEQNAIAQLKHALTDARLEIQDYELAETRDNQLTNAKRAKQYLRTVEKLITANPAGAIGAVDVAYLTAYIGQITDRLE